MKKLGLSVVSLITAGSIYYLTLGSAQITQKIKAEVNQEIQQLQNVGFKVDKTEEQPTKERFLISIDNPQKIHQYLLTQGEDISIQDLQELQGMRIKMDLSYLPSAKDAVAIDLYLDALPKSLMQGVDQNDSSLKAINEMIKAGDIMAHVNINKLLLGFDGYIKDINQTFPQTPKSHLLLNGFTFEGELQDREIKAFQQHLKGFAYEIQDALNVLLSNMQSHIEQANNTSHINYTIEALKISVQGASPFDLLLQNIQGESKDTLHGELLDNISHARIDALRIKEPHQESILEGIEIDSSTKNLDQMAFKTLQSYNQEGAKGQKNLIDALPTLKKLTQAGLKIDVSKLAIKKLKIEGESIDGFEIKGALNLDPNFNWTGVEQDPMRLMALPHIQANVSLSNQLFNRMAQTPQAMMLMLLAQPVDKNGSKIYDIEFTKGHINLNGRPFM